MRVNKALVLLAGAVVLSAVTAAPVGWARALVSLPLALVLPGYAIAAALLPARRGDGAITLALAAVASVAFYALGSLALYGLGLRVAAWPVVVSVDIVVVAAAAVLVRRGTRPPSLDLVAARSVLAVAAGLAVAGLVAFGASRVFAPSSPTPAGFSSLAFTGAWAHAVTPPLLPADRRLRFSVTVRNRTPGARRYVVVASLEGAPWQTRSLMLASGGMRVVEFDGVVAARPCSRRLYVALLAAAPRRRLTSVAMQLEACR